LENLKERNHLEGVGTVWRVMDLMQIHCDNVNCIELVQDWLMATFITAIYYLDKVQITDHSNTAPSSKTFRDEQLHLLMNLSICYK
jgi:hypothetical protein